MANYGKKSKGNLNTCDIRLQKVFNEVIKYYDNTILCGHRDKEDQNEAFYTGNSTVKWPGSQHNRTPSRAVDAAPWPIPRKWGEAHWKDKAKFYEFAGIVLYEANKQGIKLRWGGNWSGEYYYTNNTFDDLVHFELID